MTGDPLDRIEEWADRSLLAAPTRFTEVLALVAVARAARDFCRDMSGHPAYDEYLFVREGIDAIRAALARLEERSPDDPA